MLGDDLVVNPVVAGEAAMGWAMGTALAVEDGAAPVLAGDAAMCGATRFLLAGEAMMGGSTSTLLAGDATMCGAMTARRLRCELGTRR
ncbi:hypothetical protein [Nannocystis pusilla]|uniref:Uncharacterized protein n=1 Tax=Nannocystis pusilla TaxID=889268 RepID=A0ABS7U1S2_9BACT|nr:hypothetical protein [Nannocystis pusilla]MBZ5714256.1 hypothetical protein [Nannocystis pusilla]